MTNPVHSVELSSKKELLEEEIRNRKFVVSQTMEGIQEMIIHLKENKRSQQESWKEILKRFETSPDHSDEWLIILFTHWWNN